MTWGRDGSARTVHRNCVDVILKVSAGVAVQDLADDYECSDHAIRSACLVALQRHMPELYAAYKKKNPGNYLKAEWILKNRKKIHAEAKTVVDAMYFADEFDASVRYAADVLRMAGYQVDLRPEHSL